MSASSSVTTCTAEAGQHAASGSIPGHAAGLEGPGGDGSHNLPGPLGSPPPSSWDQASPEQLRATGWIALAASQAWVGPSCVTSPIPPSPRTQASRAHPGALRAGSVVARPLVQMQMPPGGCDYRHPAPWRGMRGDAALPACEQGRSGTENGGWLRCALASLASSARAHSLWPAHFCSCAGSCTTGALCSTISERSGPGEGLSPVESACTCPKEQMPANLTDAV